MQLLVQAAIIFFGTLMAAAVVALGEPARADAASAKSMAPRASQPVHHDARVEQARVNVALSYPGPGSAECP